jgi:uncharacterized phage protein (TIGR02216 family)
MKPAFPWDQAIGFGLGVLRLSPDAFWRMTPRELARAVAAVRTPVITPIRRAELDALIARFPDRSASGRGVGSS